MQGNYKEWFWKDFDKNLKLNYLLILSGMTNNRFESSHIVNHFFNTEKIAAKFYIKIASLLLDQENLENDVQAPVSTTQIGFNVHSINLKKYLTRESFDSKYESIDSVYMSRYDSKLYDLNDHFSYLLGNFIRYNKEDTININDLKRLYILTNILEIFSCDDDFVKLKVSKCIDNSFIEINNKTLIDKINEQIKIIHF